MSGPYGYTGYLGPYSVNGLDYVLHLTSPTVAGTYNFTPFVDVNHSNLLDTGDIVGTPVTLIVP